MDDLNDSKFYTIKEFAELSGWSVETIRNLYNIPQFRAFNFGREKKALGSAIRLFFEDPKSIRNFNEMKV